MQSEKDDPVVEVTFADTSRFWRKPRITISGMSDTLGLRRMISSWRYGFRVFRNGKAWLKSVDSVLLWKVKREVFLENTLIGTWKTSLYNSDKNVSLQVGGQLFSVDRTECDTSYCKLEATCEIKRNDKTIGTISVDGTDYSLAGREVKLKGQIQQTASNEHNRDANLIALVFLMGFIYLDSSETLNGFTSG